MALSPVLLPVVALSLVLSCNDISSRIREGRQEFVRDAARVVNCGSG